MFERASFHLDCLFAQKGGTKNHKKRLLIWKGRRRSIRIRRWPDARINVSEILQGIRREFSQKDVGKGKRQNKKKTEINFDVSACAGLCIQI